MGRTARQNKLLDIVAKHDIGKQDELVEKLIAAGFNATQATVSRDIKELNLVKISLPGGRGYKYVVSQKDEDDSYDKFLTIYRNTVISIASNENMIVLKTEAGSTGPASEFIDNLHIPNILGVIAGENTIFVAIDAVQNTMKVREQLEKLLK
ncbi:MAG: arginine repressor [Clostridia bacterium]|nr:arginine repressor [Clostridia bacterium]